MIKYSVSKPYTIAVAVVAVIVLGVMSFMNMTTDLMPSMNMPYVLVMTTYPGASPEEVELVVTKPVEQAMTRTGGIKNITSVSSENSSIVMLEYDGSVSIDSVSLEIREYLDIVSSGWSDTIGSPTIMKLNPNMMPVMVTAVDGKGKSVEEISRIVKDEILPALEGIEGVGSVTALGSVEPRVEILINQEKLDDLNKRVLEGVDSELADTQIKLVDAQKELEDGRTELEKQREEQTKELDKARREINNGRSKLKSALNDMKLGETELTKAKNTINSTLKEMDSQESELKKAQEPLKKQISEVEKQIKELNSELKKAEKAESALKTKVEGMKALEKELSSLFEPTDEQIAELEKTRAALAELEPELETLTQGVASIKAGLQTAQGGLSELQSALKQTEDGLSAIAAGRAEAKAGLEEVNKKESELKSGKKQVESQLSQLDKASSQVTSGKKQLETELDKAEESIAEGEKTLRGKTQEFEAARDEAYEKAMLDGVITKDMISGILAAQNFAMPAGYIDENGKEILVKVGDKLVNEEELADVLLFVTPVEGVGAVYLGDVAEIKITNNAAELYTKLNGNNGVAITFQKQATFSTAEVCEAISNKLAQIQSTRGDVEFDTLMDQGIYINIVVSSVMDNLMYGGILAIIMLLIFLRRLKPTIIVALSIPTSVVFAIVMMYFSGVNLNIVSLAGLALGVGMLVDNSIVVIENIFRMRSMGISASRAAIEGAKQVAGAISSSTLTTICVFLPIIFVEGITRELFTDMGLTIAFSLIASLIVALTLVPAMSSTMLVKHKDGDADSLKGLKRVYESMLKFTLKYKAVVLLFAAALLGLSVWYISSIGMSFMPKMDSMQLSGTIVLEKGDNENDLKEMADEVSARFMQIPDIEVVGASIGGGAMMGGTDSVSVYISLKDDKQSTSEEVAYQMEQAVKDLPCKVSIQSSNMDMSAISGEGVSISVKGHDMDTLTNLAKDIALKLDGIEGLTEISSGTEDNTSELRVRVNKSLAMRWGLTVAQVFQQLSDTIKDGTEATTISMGSEDYPVIVMDGKAEGLTREKLMQLSITASNDREVRLCDIAVVEEATSPNAINHDSQQRVLRISAKPDAGYNIGLLGKEIEKIIESYPLPEGYTANVEGENETIVETLTNLLLMVGLAIILIYLIMVAQFQSFLSPFIVMFTIPLAFTGGMLALIITGNELSAISMLGFLILSGVVVNNGIVFVDYINRLRIGGMDKREAIVETGRTRLRPILMTAMTTILGLMTLAFGVGMGAEMLQPMAIVTIGGLLYATLLTLFVVPALYDLINRRPIKVRSQD